MKELIQTGIYKITDDTDNLFKKPSFEVRHSGQYIGSYDTLDEARKAKEAQKKPKRPKRQLDDKDAIIKELQLAIKKLIRNNPTIVYKEQHYLEIMAIIRKTKVLNK